MCNLISGTLITEHCNFEYVYPGCGRNSKELRMGPLGPIGALRQRLKKTGIQGDAGNKVGTKEIRSGQVDSQNQSGRRIEEIR